LMMGAPQTVEEAQARAVANRMKVEDMEALVKAVTDEAKGMDGVEDAAALKEVQKKVVEAEGNVRELQQGTAHEIGEVRKGGPLCQSVITEMSKVLPRIQVMTQSLKTLNHKLKAKIPREKTAEELKKEETDKELFSTAEPEVNKAVEEAGSALNGIARLADAIEAETADAAVDALTEIVVGVPGGAGQNHRGAHDNQHAPAYSEVFCGRRSKNRFEGVHRQAAGTHRAPEGSECLQRVSEAL